MLKNVIKYKVLDHLEQLLWCFKTVKHWLMTFLSINLLHFFTAPAAPQRSVTALLRSQPSRPPAAQTFLVPCSIISCSSRVVSFAHRDGMPLRKNW